MRMRKKPNLEPRTEKCRSVMIEDPNSLRGRWREFFGRPELPLHLEIGCGKGKFAVEMAQKYPEVLFVAVERDPSALLLAMEKALPLELKNLYFISSDVQKLSEAFAPEEVDCIYLNFSDPWPKKRYAKRRLTYRSFLALYDKFLTKEGQICFKTDNKGLFEFSICELSQYGFGLHDVTFDLHATDFDNVMTEYEKSFTDKGQNIYRLVAKRRVEITPEPVETTEEEVR